MENNELGHILEKDKDAFINVIPNGFPPEREVDHEMELETGLKTRTGLCTNFIELTCFQCNSMYMISYRREKFYEVNHHTERQFLLWRNLISLDLDCGLQIIE